MIVVDTSAIVAIDFREPEFMTLPTRLFQYASRYIPATAIVEGTMVLSRLHKDPKTVMNGYLTSLRLTPVPIDAAIAGVAQEAFIKFGKGRHPARLNLSDCFSYAAAKSLNAPLLFVGGDFAKTDIEIA